MDPQLRFHLDTHSQTSISKQLGKIMELEFTYGSSGNCWQRSIQKGKQLVFWWKEGASQLHREGRRLMANGEDNGQDHKDSIARSSATGEDAAGRVRRGAYPDEGDGATGS
ncbi:uncharacterized protein DS421_20g691660 [Arachis hypogaea]|nr:uncharacterized protein DS421_20g691660 [Arachis hypogaea]